MSKSALDSDIDVQMKKLHEMSKILESQLSSLQNLGDINTDGDEEIFDGGDLEDDDEIIELPGTTPVPLPIVAALSPKKEPVEVILDDDVDMEEESREILESSDPFDEDVDDSNDSDLFEQSMYVGHNVDPQEAEPIIKDFKDEKVDISDLNLPSTWSVKYAKGKLEGKFLYTSPDGRYFHSVQSCIEWMLENDFPKEDVEIMRGNLRFEGWQEADYLPLGWLLCYYKATNGYLYLSPDCRLFKSAKSVTNFMKKNNYNPSIIEDVKKNMLESKKFNSKIKYKWLPGDNTLPKGWKMRKAKGSGRHQTMIEFFLSEDGVQFKSRFEGLHYMIKNKSSESKIQELRKKLVESSEKWKESKLLPKGWLYKFKGEDSKKDKNPTTTAITYFSKEGYVYHSMKNAMDFMINSQDYDDQDLQNCKEFLKSVVKYAERKYDNWETGKETVPDGWKVRISDSDTDREQILSPEGIAYRFVISFNPEG